jgi:hypothetical protein
VRPGQRLDVGLRKARLTHPALAVGAGKIKSAFGFDNAPKVALLPDESRGGSTRYFFGASRVVR